MSPELVSLLITQAVPLLLKEYETLRQKGDFTLVQLAALDKQIASYSDYSANPQWKPDDK